MDGRCECGSRIFFNKQTLITTANGSIRDIPSIMVMECVRCSRTYQVSTDPGVKTLIPFKSGMEAEKSLFLAALESWKNTDRPQSNESLIVLDDADRKDFERLGVPAPPEAVTK